MWECRESDSNDRNGEGMSPFLFSPSLALNAFALRRHTTHSSLRDPSIVPSLFRDRAYLEFKRTPMLLGRETTRRLGRHSSGGPR